CPSLRVEGHINCRRTDHCSATRSAAIQGEYSKTLPRAATKSSLLQAFKSERRFDISPLLLKVRLNRAAAIQIRLDVPRLITSPAPSTRATIGLPHASSMSIAVD